METKTMCCPHKDCKYQRNAQSKYRYTCKCPFHRVLLITRYEKSKLKPSEWESDEEYRKRYLSRLADPEMKKFPVWRRKKGKKQY